MTAQLPQALAQYFAAKNSYETSTVWWRSSTTTPASETRARSIAAARRSGPGSSMRRANIASPEVKDVARDGGRDIVSGVVSGDFPGSPAALRYAFTLAGTKITRLEIV